jgi:hypothetical protein
MVVVVEVMAFVLRTVVARVVDNYHHRHPYHRMDSPSDFLHRDRRVPQVDSCYHHHPYRHTVDWTFDFHHMDPVDLVYHKEMHMIEYHYN